MDYKHEIGLLIENAMEAAFGQKVEGCENFLETPPKPELGDFAFPCFRLAKALRMGPPQIAAKLAGELHADFVEKCEQNGGYLNFFLKKDEFAREMVEKVLAMGDKFGSSDLGSGKTVCLDYSSINIAKPFHIGHLLTTVIGNSLCRIYKFLGYDTVSINHLGDWGTQFGKLIYAYQQWGDKKKIEENPMRELVAIYVRFHDEAEKDDSLNDAARACFRKMELGDPECLEIYNWFKEITLREIDRMYSMLGITFHSYNGEAFYQDKTDGVVQMLRDKNLLVESQGAYVVDLEEHGMPPFIALRSDGATLYATRDLAAAFYRKENYNFDKCLYIVAYQQNLHFKQLFKVIELMGCEWAKDMEHVAFGMVSMEDGAMSTRHGHVIYLDDVFTAAIAKAKEIMLEKSPDLADMDECARKVGVGAVVFSALYNNRIKDMVFSWDRALNFDGETGPYVQYTYARCCSVLGKAPETNAAPNYATLSDPSAAQVVALLEKFPAVVRDAASRNEPCMISRHMVALSQAYNKFYFDNRILCDDEADRAARLNLTLATRQVLKTGLDLIGVAAPEKM